MQGFFQVEQLSYQYKSERFRLGDLSFSLRKGEILSLVGPSGCGKSTMLQLLAGFLTPATGRVIVDGQDLTAWPPEKRHMGLVFQNYALFPHLNVLSNILFGLRIRGGNRAAQREKGLDMLERVGLDASFAQRKPDELSGGQQQRVALARALILEPRVLFLDEPLANLDRRLRETMRAEILRLCREWDMTTILVTHDQEEALSMGDSVAVMKDGAIEQWGSPEECYQHPKSLFVSEFLGDVNLFAVAKEGTCIKFSEIPYSLTLVSSQALPTVAAIRPEFIKLCWGESQGGLKAELDSVVFVGAAYEIYVRVKAKVIKVKSPDRPLEKTVYLNFDETHWLFYP